MNNNKNKINLSLLVFTRLVSDLGTWIFRFALSLYILDVTGSAAKFSFIFGLTILPGVIVPLFAGIIADKYNRKNLLISSELISGIVVFVLAASFIPGDANMLLFSTYAIVINLFQAFAKMTILASIPNVVDEKYIVTANSYVQGISGVVNLLGPILGALLYAEYGLLTIFYIDGISFLVAGLVTFSLSIRPTANSGVKESILKSLKGSIGYLKTFPGLPSGVLVMFIINLVLVPIIFTGTTYISYKLFNLTKQEVSFIYSSFFIGIVIGAIAISVFKLGEILSTKFFGIIKLLAIALSLMLIIPLINPISPLLIIAVMSSSMLFLGLFLIAMQIPLFSSLQIKIPDDKRGSVFGILASSSEAALPIGVWIYGLLFGNIQWYYLVLFAVIMTFLTGIISQQNKDLKKIITI